MHRMLSGRQWRMCANKVRDVATVRASETGGTIVQYKSMCKISVAFIRPVCVWCGVERCRTNNEHAAQPDC